MPCQLPVVAAARLGHEQCSMMMSSETHLQSRLPHGCIFVGMTFSRSAVADNTGGCGRRPLIIVCRFSHLLLRKYYVLLRKLVEMAGNFGDADPCIVSNLLCFGVGNSWLILSALHQSFRLFHRHPSPLLILNIIPPKREVLTIGPGPMSYGCGNQIAPDMQPVHVMS